MTLLSVAREKTTTTTAPSRALRALPATALAVDLVVVTTVGLLAAIGRERLDLFDKSARVVDTLGVAAPLIVVGWLVAIAVFGGYRRHIFGAGSDEYKSVVNASFVAMGLVGIGCYLARFTLSRGFFLLAFALGIPAAGARALPAPPRAPHAPSTGRPAAARRDRGFARAHRRDRQRPAPRAVAGLRRGRRADPAVAT